MLHISFSLVNWVVCILLDFLSILTILYMVVSGYLFDIVMKIDFVVINLFLYIT